MTPRRPDGGRDVPPDDRRDAGGVEPVADAPPGEDADSPPLVGNWLSTLEDRFARCERLAVCLDFDGTLAPIVADPDDASVPARTRDALQRLADREAIDPAVVSGRALPDLRGRVPVDACALAGNHGLEIDRGGDVWVHPDAEAAREALERTLEEVETRLDAHPDCWIEDKDVTATVHHRGAGADAATVEGIVEAAVADEPALEATVGRKIVEIRPAVDWDKGDAVRALTPAAAAAVYVGDDVTDEDGFAALAALPCGGIGVLVGDRPSAADYRVHDVDGVRAFLEWLADAPVGGAAPDD